MTSREAGGAIVTLVTLAGLLFVIRRGGAWHLRRVASATTNRVDDLIADLLDRTHPVTLLTVAASVATVTWLPTAPAPAAAVLVASLVIALQAGVWAAYIVESFAARRKASAVEAGNAADATAWTALSIFARAMIWCLVLVVALDNVGIDVTALIAGLGVGGLAVGLALQSVLGDVFASLAIVLDRPFVIGDFLEVDDVAGTVEHIGIKTTRLRALSGEQVVLSNAELLKSRIRNFQNLAERRNLVSFGVLYDTSADMLAQIPVVAREVVAEQPETRFDRAHLVRFGESSIDFELAYFLADSDFNRHMDVQQAVLLALFRRFAELGVVFAYPTRTLYLHSPGGRSSLVEPRAPIG